MFVPLGVTVKSLGEDVILSIGQWKRTIHFEVAVMLAAWLDECSRMAKDWADDTQRLLKGVGTLHDASDHRWIMAGQPFDPRHVPIVNRDRLKLAKIAVRQVESLVVLKAGEAEALQGRVANLANDPLESQGIADARRGYHAALVKHHTGAQGRIRPWRDARMTWLQDLRLIAVAAVVAVVIVLVGMWIGTRAEKALNDKEE